MWPPFGGSLIMCGPQLQLSGDTFVPKTSVCVRCRLCVCVCVCGLLDVSIYVILKP